MPIHLARVTTLWHESAEPDVTEVYRKAIDHPTLDPVMRGLLKQGLEEMERLQRRADVAVFAKPVRVPDVTAKPAEVMKPAKPVETAVAPEFKYPKDTAFIIGKGVKVDIIIEADSITSLRVPADGSMTLGVKGEKIHCVVKTKRVRQAVELIRQHGADNVYITLKGKLMSDGTIKDAGLIAMAKQPKPDATSAAPVAILAAPDVQS